MKKTNIVDSAARAVALYDAYRKAALTHPYDPVAVGDAFIAWRSAMKQLSAAARQDVLRYATGHPPVADTAADASVRRLLHLPLTDEERLRLVTEVGLRLEAGATLDAVLAWLAE